MNYTVFSDHIQGQAKKDLGMECEDYSAHFADPRGRYAIGVVCDGHSDPKCFRSAVGARLGSFTAVELLKNFFECCCDESAGAFLDDLLNDKEQTAGRLRAAFISKWTRAWADDLKERPLTEAELNSIPKKDADWAELYRQGRKLSTIYGATMLAVGLCGDLHVAMQIGDGVIVRLDKNGNYDAPLPEDRREDGIDSPASMCDDDLLSRAGAFRIDFFPYLPQALFCMSDGVGDMPLSIQLREHLLRLHRGMLEKGDEAKEGLSELNDAQQAYVHSFNEAFSKQGLQDDCSIAGLYATGVPAADVRLSESEIDSLYRSMKMKRSVEEQSFAAAFKKVEEARSKVEAVVQGYRKQLDSLQREIDRVRGALGRSENDASHPPRTMGIQRELREQAGMPDSKNGDAAESACRQPAEPTAPCAEGESGDSGACSTDE